MLLQENPVRAHRAAPRGHPGFRGLLRHGAHQPLRAGVWRGHPGGRRAPARPSPSGTRTTPTAARRRSPAPAPLPPGGDRHHLQDVRPLPRGGGVRSDAHAARAERRPTSTSSSCTRSPPAPSPRRCPPLPTCSRCRKRAWCARSASRRTARPSSPRRRTSRRSRSSARRSTARAPASRRAPCWDMENALCKAHSKARASTSSRSWARASSRTTSAARSPGRWSGASSWTPTTWAWPTSPRRGRT